MQKPLIEQAPETPYIEVLKEVYPDEAAGKTLYATVSAHGDKNRMDYVMVTVHTDESRMMGQYMVWCPVLQMQKEAERLRRKPLCLSLTNAE